jgi:hypothetical protein
MPSTIAARPRQWIRATSWGCLLDEGYHDDPHEALKLVDVETVVEVVHPPRA